MTFGHYKVTQQFHHQWPVFPVMPYYMLLCVALMYWSFVLTNCFASSKQNQMYRSFSVGPICLSLGMVVSVKNVHIVTKLCALTCQIQCCMDLKIKTKCCMYSGIYFLSENQPLQTATGMPHNPTQLFLVQSFALGIAAKWDGENCWQCFWVSSLNACLARFLINVFVSCVFIYLFIYLEIYFLQFSSTWNWDLGPNVASGRNVQTESPHSLNEWLTRKKNKEIQRGEAPILHHFCLTGGDDTVSLSVLVIAVIWWRLVAATGSLSHTFNFKVCSSFCQALTCSLSS